MKSRTKIRRLQDINKFFGRSLYIKPLKKPYNELYSIVSNNRGMKIRGVIILFIIVTIPPIMLSVAAKICFNNNDVNLMLGINVDQILGIIFFQYLMLIAWYYTSSKLDLVLITPLNKECLNITEKYLIILYEKHKKFRKKINKDPFAQKIYLKGEHGKIEL